MWLVAGEIAALLPVIAVPFALHLFGRESGLWPLHFWLTFPAGPAPWMPVDDSWTPMRAAYEWFAQAHHGSIYQHIFFEQHIKFQYPPSSLLLFAIPAALHLPLPNYFLNLVGWFSVLVEAVVTVAIVLAATRDAEWACQNPHLRYAGAALGGLAVFTFHPVIWSFSLGQIQTWLNAWFVVAVLCFLTGRRGLAGALVGAICLIKPQFGLFLVWALLRREWRFVRGMAIVAGAGLGLSILVFGVQNHLDYLSVIAYMSRHGEAYYPNNSVNGVMNRLLGNGNSVTFSFHDFAPFNPLVYGLTVASTLVLDALCLFYRRKEKANLADFMIAGLTFTMASPIVWEHHYGFVPPIFAVLAIMLVRRAPTPKRAIYAALLAAAYVVAASFIPPVPWLMSGPASLFCASTFFAGLTLLILLYLLREDSPAVPVR